MQSASEGAILSLRYERFPWENLSRDLSKAGEDHRSDGQIDRDRILYTSAFRRLAGVTQVVAAHEGHVFHNRLTHSLEVAQFGRRLAERIVQNDAALAIKAGGVDPDIVEAAALAHDLGHPPFGHIAEKTLDKLLTDREAREGFEGNAQSFRIVNGLAVRRLYPPGLDLSRATLNAMTKYPWERAVTGHQHDKWGTYHSEVKFLDWARKHFPAGNKLKSVEARLMEWADDVAYAVHDAEDFFRAGLVPLDRLATDKAELRRFFTYARSKHPNDRELRDIPWDKLEAVFAELMPLMPTEPYSSLLRIRSNLRTFTSSLISRYINAPKLHDCDFLDERAVQIDADALMEVWMLKRLTAYYVIERPGLATQQYGQRKVISDLFEIFADAAYGKKMDLDIFPAGFKEHLESLHKDAVEDLENECLRTVADLIAGMTEQDAASMHHRLTGARGSITDYISR